MRILHFSHRPIIFPDIVSWEWRTSTVPRGQSPDPERFWYTARNYALL